MDRKLMILLLLVVCIGLFFIFSGNDNLTSSPGIPDPYYVELKKADVNNADDVIRYSSAIKNYGSNLDIFERAAFYEWYFKSHNFNVTFAYTDSFDDTRRSHVWLLVRTRKGETIEVDPSYQEMGKFSMVPLDPEYTRYDREFEDIYAASKHLDVSSLAWWEDENARSALDENILLAKKEEAMRVAGK